MSERVEDTTLIPFGERPSEDSFEGEFMRYIAELRAAGYRFDLDWEITIGDSNRGSEIEVKVRAWKSRYSAWKP
jgi:hypothetical protein